MAWRKVGVWRGLALAAVLAGCAAPQTGPVVSLARPGGGPPVVLVSGTLDAQAGLDLGRMLEQVGPGVPVYLISRGGDRGGQREVARALQRHPGNPAVAVACVSACANAWAMAPNREIKPDGHLLFHSVWCADRDLCTPDGVARTNAMTEVAVASSNPRLYRLLMERDPRLWKTADPDVEVVLSAEEVVAHGAARLAFRPRAAGVRPFTREPSAY